MSCQISLFEQDAPPTVGGRRDPMVIDLTGYDRIVVNDSGGKDSHCATRRVCTLAAEQGVLGRVVIQYNKLGSRVTWPGTRELGQHLVDRFGDRPGCQQLVEANAAHYGVPVAVTARDGLDLLDDIERRGKFPDAARRWCTSDFKRAPGMKLLTGETKRLGLERPARILYVFGFRAQESEGRRRKVAQPLNLNATASNKTRREVWDWYPIHDWTTEDVWADIRESGLPYAWPYDAGMTRLSCSLCVLASEADLLLAAYLRPDLACAYLAVEQKIGHSFQQSRSMADIIARSQAKYGWTLTA